MTVRMQSIVIRRTILAWVILLGSFALAQTPASRPLHGSSLVDSALGARRFIGFGRSNQPTGFGGPYYPIAADLNGDGNADLVNLDGFNSGTTSQLSVLLGNGDGTFGQHVDYDVPYFAVAPVVSDFTGDGVPDIAVGNAFADGGLFVLIGNGDGTFHPGDLNSSAPPGASNGVAADINGDGRSDVVYASLLPSELVVMFGNGDGTFADPLIWPVGSPNSANGVAVADFNHDGLPDVAVSLFADDELAIFLNTGTGTLQFEGTFSTGAGPDQIAATDLDADGNIDLAVDASSEVSVLRGNGDGTFQLSSGLMLTGIAGGIAATDLNGDAIPDLVVPRFLNGDTLTVFLGAPGGQFQTPAYFVGTSSVGIAVADFNKDGMVDAALASLNGDAVTILQQSPAVLSPTRLNFGDVQLGSSSTKTLLLHNVGASTIRIHGFRFSGKAIANFTQTNDCPATLNAGQKCRVSVTFAPNSFLTFDAQLALSDSGTRGSQTIVLTGVGVQ